MPGVHSQPNAPLPLTLDGKIVVKHEETIEKSRSSLGEHSRGGGFFLSFFLDDEPNHSHVLSPLLSTALVGNYFKRESEAAAVPKARKKPSEKQMARDDIKLLLAE